MSGCRVCDSNIEPFIDFGRMPLANGFLTPDRFAGEYYFNLRAACCPRCTLVQLVEQPLRERMFNERYPFFSATSVADAGTLCRVAGDVIATLPAGDPFVVEIGSNDGTLLRHVARRGHPPSRHRAIRQRADGATAGGVDTIGAFFDASVAREIVAGARPGARDRRRQRAVAHRRPACRRRRHRDPARAGRHLRHRRSVLGRRRRPDRLRSDLRRTCVVLHTVVVVAAVRAARPGGPRRDPNRRPRRIDALCDRPAGIESRRPRASSELLEREQRVGTARA